MTTVFRFKDETILRNRKRSASTSTNTHIIRSVFEDFIRK